MHANENTQAKNLRRDSGDKSKFRFIKCSFMLSAALNLSSTMSPLLKILNFKAGCYEKRFKESRKWTQDLKNWKQAQDTKQRLKQKLVSIWGEVKAEEHGRVFLHTLRQLTHNTILDIGTTVPILPMRKHTHDNTANLGWSWDLPSDLSPSLASSHVTYPLSSPWN